MDGAIRNPAVMRWALAYQKLELDLQEKDSWSLQPQELPHIQVRPVMQVMAFVAKRLANEQAPVVDVVMSTLAEKVPLELFSPNHVPHLQKLRDDVALSEDSMTSTQEALAGMSLKLLRRQLKACSALEEDQLLAFAMDMLYRSVLCVQDKLARNGSDLEACLQILSLNLWCFQLAGHSPGFFQP